MGRNLHASCLPLAVVCLVAASCVGSPSQAGDPPPQIPAYMRFFVHYAPHAESIWQTAGRGGYWGDGLAGGNGGIRGTSNLTLAMAWLALAYDEGWLSESEQAGLAAAGLDRDVCLRRVQASWRYLADCHLTGSGASAVDRKRWGRSWQSSLWVGASGLAALLVWDELDPEVREDVRRVIVDEADAKIGVPPRDAEPGNTAAEENGWDTHAPAIALALFPDSPQAAAWLRAAQLLAVNTYSVAADRTSEARIGQERLRDVVTTANLADDFTLSNHGFFHPSYIKVSGQELGEAWALLAWGDRRHGTRWAEQFRPYALHHVGEVWNRVMRPLLLPEGEFAFPAGQDWALHMPTTQSYFAYIATSLRDPLAALAERRGLEVAELHRTASPDSRIFGVGDFEWWWEPILLKRYVTAMLHFLLTTDLPAPADPHALRDRDEYHHFPNAGIIVRRTPRYFTSLAIRPTPNALIIPLGEQDVRRSMITTPRTGSILPAGTIIDYAVKQDPAATAVILNYADGTQMAMVASPGAVLWLSNGTLNSVAIQNDALVTGVGRQIHSPSGAKHVPPLTAMEPFATEGTWLNVDGQLALVSARSLDYRPAGALTRRSAAEDLITPRPDPGGTVLLAGPSCSVEETRRMAESLQVTREDGSYRIRFRDPQTAVVLNAEIDLAPRPGRFAPVEIQVQGQVGDRSPLAHLTDNDAATAVVLRNTAGTGPTPDAPITLEFRRPPSAMSATHLHIAPRPGYGPRDITIDAWDRDRWRQLAPVTLAEQPAIVPVKDVASAERFRLTITSGWDRGLPQPQPPRNTQISELSFGGSAIPPAHAVRVRIWREE